MNVAEWWSVCLVYRRTWVVSMTGKPAKQGAILLIKVKANLDCISLHNTSLASASVKPLGRSLAEQPALETDGYCSVEVTRLCMLSKVPISVPHLDTDHVKTGCLDKIQMGS